ncbi:MAG: hypothetical protein H6732_02040 [Alphaproteobacteria bacterium]|nr:hypothetical protein [Alphaproteobacteria bacterium]
MTLGRSMLATALVATLPAPLARADGTPADRMPTPRAERCVGFVSAVDEGEAAAPMGLHYEEVKPALHAAIQFAAYCPRPAGVSRLHLTFELMVGCDGLVSEIEVSDDGGAPATYVTCVREVLQKADFPAHDMRDGFPITYPVNVAW